MQLVEILIALFIFSVALLGFAQMQILSLKNTEEALQDAMTFVKSAS